MQVTDSAATLIASYTQRLGSPDGGLRIQRADDAERPNALQTRYVQDPLPEDAVVTSGDARVFVAPDVQAIVDPYVLDARQEGEQHRLFLR